MSTPTPLLPGNNQQQFIRSASLVLARQGQPIAPFVDAPGQGLDLSDMHFTFRVMASDVETPNTAVIRVFNLSQNTEKQALQEYDSVVLQAGYESNLGAIFKGTIKQFHRGRERNTDSYLDILAADGDIPYNFATINQTLTAGATQQQQLEALVEAMGIPVDHNASGYLLGGIQNPRGKTLFGLARTYMRDLARTNGVRWSIQQGVLTLIPLTGYLPGTAVQINSVTGMIGIPEATDDGIKITTLLNPTIRVGGQVQVNEGVINQTIIRDRFFPGYQSQTFVADTSRDGFYRVLVIEHEGDTRGQAWYTHLTCLTLDPTVQPIKSVKAFG